MFGKDYKALYEECKQKLHDTHLLLEKISRESDKLHIVKFVVDNPDQFQLDGEFCRDDSSVAYGGKAVSFSEAVMFKAGKEAAKKEFDVIHAELDQAAAVMESKVTRLEDKCDDWERENRMLRIKCSEALAEKRDSDEEHKKILEDENKKFDAAVSAYENTIADLNRDLIALRTELSQWRRGELVEMTLPVSTCYGVIGADLL